MLRLRLKNNSGVCVRDFDAALARWAIWLTSHATLSGMAFKVECNPPEPSHTFDDDDKFEFMDGGVLKVRRSNETNLYFSPAVWRTIHETSPRFTTSRSSGHGCTPLGPF
jgi:hypothetical protein